MTPVSMAMAQQHSDPGKTVAETHCASCHALPGDTDTGVAPELSEIAASQQTWTDIDLRLWLPREHGARADVDLNSQEAYELGRYLQKLEKRQDLPSFSGQ